MAVGRAYYFMLTFWGERHREYFYSLLLPTLLSPNNFPILRSRPGSKLIICTTKQDWDALKNRPLVRALGEYVEPLALFIGYPKKFKPDQHHVNVLHMSQGHRLAAKRAYDDGAVAGFLAPDLLCSDGLIGKAVELIESGKKAVLCPALRFAMEPVLSRLSHAGFLQPEQPMTLSPLLMSSIAARSLHPEILRYEFEGRDFDERPYWVFWRVPEREGIILYTMSWALLLGDYAALPKHHDASLETSSVDGVYVWQNFGHLRESNAVAFIRNSTQGLFMSLTPERELVFTGFPRLLNRAADLLGIGRLRRLSDIYSIYLRDFDPWRRWLYRVPLVLHSEPLDSRYRRRLRHARRMMLTALGPNPPPSSLMLRSFQKCERLARRSHHLCRRGLDVLKGKYSLRYLIRRSMGRSHLDQISDR